jgi:hypothetical protein
MRIPALLVGVLLVGAVAGCAGTGTVADETNTTVATPVASSALTPPSATPTVSPTLTPTLEPSPLDDVVLSTEGLGPIAIGEPMPAAASDLVEWDADYCGGGWVPAIPATAENGWDFFPISGESKKSPVTLIEVFSPRFQTADGIGTGSTVDALLDAGFTVAGEPHGGTGMQPYALDGSNGRLVAWVWAGNNEESLLGSVASFDIMPRGSDPAFSYTVGKCH